MCYSREFDSKSHNQNAIDQRSTAFTARNLYLKMYHLLSIVANASILEVNPALDFPDLKWITEQIFRLKEQEIAYPHPLPYAL